MDSIWNGYIPWIPHGFHILTYKSSTYYNGFHMEFMWNPCPFHVYSFHMDSIWIPCGTYPILRWNKDLRT